MKNGSTNWRVRLSDKGSEGRNKNCGCPLVKKSYIHRIKISCNENISCPARQNTKNGPVNSKYRIAILRETRLLVKKG